MASSTLDPDMLTTRPDRIIGKGHGTQALGPSDSSDSGSDLFGAPGLAHQIGLGLTKGNTSDPEENTADNTAGPDIGDADLDSDSDSSGTGERAAAARDTVAPDGADIDIDQIETLPYEEEEPHEEPAIKRRNVERSQ